MERRGDDERDETDVQPPADEGESTLLGESDDTDHSVEEHVDEQLRREQDG